MLMELQHGDSMGVFNQHLYTYHVVYNESYRVPMLFLQGRLQGPCLDSTINKIASTSVFCMHTTIG